MSDFESVVFDKCREINNLLETKQENVAREGVIKLLDLYKKNNRNDYTALVNHLIRLVGLYPYVHTNSASFMDQIACEMFKVDVGANNNAILHLAQSSLLKKLLSGVDVAVSAPTSFGKSFIIDAFIAIKKPRNVVIVVPTIALMDETRRRLYQKFSNEYEIVTTTNAVLGEKNILVFPQERAFAFRNSLKEIDILVIDEFYKASLNFDKERASALIKCILEFSPIAKQRYFLAPNISEILDNPFTKGFSFEKIDFKTVFLNVVDYYAAIKIKPEDKSSTLNQIIIGNPGKTLIYAGSYPEIEKLKTIFSSSAYLEKASPLLHNFSKWLSKNYTADWALSNLVKKGIGIHNGRLHRSLAQIQVRLFDDEQGLDKIISTSSIIEGVNTAAENVVIWKNCNGRSNLNSFTYKNIIGRGGRMFQHFVGNVFLLDKTPEEKNIQLDLPLPKDSILDEDRIKDFPLDEDEKKEILQGTEDVVHDVGKDLYESIKDSLHESNIKQASVKRIIKELFDNANKWKGINYLNSDKPEDWSYLLKSMLFLQNRHWDFNYDIVVLYIQTISQNWQKPIPEILDELSDFNIGVDEFFKLEKEISFDFSQFLSLFNTLQKNILQSEVDLGNFITKISNAFLPPVVLQLEEFGLPRMISRKIHESGAYDFEQKDLDIHLVINWFKTIGFEHLKNKVSFDPFDLYILEYFYEGITTTKC